MGFADIFFFLDTFWADVQAFEVLPGRCCNMPSTLLPGPIPVLWLVSLLYLLLCEPARQLFHARTMPPLFPPPQIYSIGCCGHWAAIFVGWIWKQRCVATVIADLILKHGWMKKNKATSLLSPKHLMFVQLHVVWHKGYRTELQLRCCSTPDASWGNRLFLTRHLASMAVGVQGLAQPSLCYRQRHAFTALG